MKLFTLFAVLSISVSAQEKVGTYNSSSLRREFNIRTISENNTPILYLEVFNGLLQDRYYFKVDELASFIDALSQTRSTFVSWQKIAKGNNYPITTKGMNISFPVISVYWYDSFDKKFTFLENLNLMPIFTVSNRECRFQLSALSAIVKDQAYSVVLSNAKEFDKLISNISPDALKTKLYKLKIKENNYP